MDLDVVLDPRISPSELAEVATRAEALGVRAVWASNYHHDRDPFVALAPAALATSRIKLGVLAVSPWELHPLKMATATLTLNEIAEGRAMVAVSGGGGVLGALGWKLGDSTESWPAKDADGDRYPERRIRGVRECVELLATARTGELLWPFRGDVFQTHRPADMSWTPDDGPMIYTCSSGPMMIRLGARVADAIQLSDLTVDEMPSVMTEVEAGLARREDELPQLRVGNFWAWHIKEDRDASMREARRELIWRRGLVSRSAESIRPFCNDEAEVELVLDNYMSFMTAFFTGSGQIGGVPEDLVERLIAGMSSAGDFADVEREVARLKRFAAAGLDELALRLGDDPMNALELIGERVLPELV